MTKVVSISVEGPVGCGKSAIAYEIVTAMRALGLKADLLNVGDYDVSGDAQASLDIYRDGIEIVVSETINTLACVEMAVGGAYDMPEIGRQFWIDRPVAREIAKRVLARRADPSYKEGARP